MLRTFLLFWVLIEADEKRKLKVRELCIGCPWPGTVIRLVLY